MIDLITVMKDWGVEQSDTVADRPQIVFRDAQSHPMKTSARIEIDDPDVMGQIILWETGECEIDLGSTRDPHKTMIESHRFSSPGELTAALDRALEFCREIIS